MWSRDQDGLDTVLEVGTSSDTPPQGQVSRKREKKKGDIGKKGEIFLRRNKAKRVMMTKKRDQREGFSKDVGCHVRCGNLCSCERAIVKMLADKVVVNIYMFGARRNDVSIGNSACTLVITIDWE